MLIFQPGQFTYQAEVDTKITYKSFIRFKHLKEFIDDDKKMMILKSCSKQ
jgi:hypothetical protein